MDKIIATVLLIVGGVTCTVMVINTAIPAIHDSSNDLASVADTLDNRIKTDIDIIQVIGELDSGGSFDDSDADGVFDVFVWVKNVGKTGVGAIDTCDVFYGQTGNFKRYTYDASDTVRPAWHYEIEGGGADWEIADTCRFELTFSSAEATGTYWVKVILPNGIWADHDFSM